MAKLEIRPQPHLGMTRTGVITLNGIRYRLFRSAVTVVVVSVAIAFMMNILSEGILKRSVVRMTRDRIRDMRLVSTWTGRLTTPPSLSELLHMAADAAPTSPEYRQYMALGGMSGEAMNSLHAEAAVAVGYLGFFDGLEHAKRRLLAHGAEGTEVFDRLSHPRSFTRFRNHLKNLRSVRFPGSVDSFAAFVERWPRTRDQAEAILDGWAGAIRTVRAHVGDQPMVDALREATGSFGGVIRGAGFVLSDATARALAHQATQVSHRRTIEGGLSYLPVRQFIAGRMNVLPGQVNARRLWAEAGSSPEAAEELLNVARSSGVDLSEIDADRVIDLARLREEEVTLLRAEQASGDIGSGFMGLGERTAWLVLISVVVCIVGIANVMLISVAERFREIATLKCLGALDSFIMVMFVLEAALLGVVGGLLGAALGSAIGLLRTVGAFGSLAFRAFPLVEMLQAVVLSVLLGVILAAIAAIYPSFRAAKLPPMEAMRIE